MTKGKFGEGRHRAEVMQKLRRISASLESDEVMQKLRRLSGASLASEGSEQTSSDSLPPASPSYGRQVSGGR